MLRVRLGQHPGAVAHCWVPERQTTSPRRPYVTARLSRPRPLPGAGRGRRAGLRGSESRAGRSLGSDTPQQLWGAQSAQAQRVGWQQHPVAAVLAAASCNRCRQVGASAGGWRGSLLAPGPLVLPVPGLGGGRERQEKQGQGPACQPRCASPCYAASGGGAEAPDRR